jgi:hypothetical protein
MGEGGLIGDGGQWRIVELLPIAEQVPTANRQ